MRGHERGQNTYRCCRLSPAAMMKRYSEATPPPLAAATLSIYGTSSPRHATTDELPFYRNVTVELQHTNRLSIQPTTAAMPPLTTHVIGCHHRRICCPALECCDRHNTMFSSAYMKLANIHHAEHHGRWRRQRRRQKHRMRGKARIHRQLSVDIHNIRLQ